ncbi:MAG: hypothetical protein J6Y59_04150 [Bacteroidaceae bacterium]|nr:hypothetical protein [Bacteroidaceae bacterium]
MEIHIRNLTTSHDSQLVLRNDELASTIIRACLGAIYGYNCVCHRTILVNGVGYDCSCTC